MVTTFQGEEVELRSLGVSDVFEVQRICVDIIQGAELRNLKLAASDDVNETIMAFAMFLFSGVDFAEKRIIDWIRSMFVGTYEKEISLVGLLEFVEILIDHPSIEAFLEQARRLAPKLLKLAIRTGHARNLTEIIGSTLQEPETKSATVTVGSPTT